MGRASRAKAERRASGVPYTKPAKVKTISPNQQMRMKASAALNALKIPSQDQG